MPRWLLNLKGESVVNKTGAMRDELIHDVCNGMSSVL